MGRDEAIDLGDRFCLQSVKYYCVFGSFVNQNHEFAKVRRSIDFAIPLRFLRIFTYFSNDSGRFVKIASRKKRAIGLFFKELMKSAKRSVKSSTLGKQA